MARWVSLQRVFAAVQGGAAALFELGELSPALVRARDSGIEGVDEPALLAAREADGPLRTVDWSTHVLLPHIPAQPAPESTAGVFTDRRNTLWEGTGQDPTRAPLYILLDLTLYAPFGVAPQ